MRWEAPVKETRKLDFMEECIKSWKAEENDLRKARQDWILVWSDKTNYIVDTRNSELKGHALNYLFKLTINT